MNDTTTTTESTQQTELGSYKAIWRYSGGRWFITGYLVKPKGHPTAVVPDLFGVLKVLAGPDWGGY